MRRPTTSPVTSLLLAVVAAVLLGPATAGAQSYDDPLLSGYGGPGAGEQSLFGGQLLAARGGGGDRAVAGAPRTTTGELDLSAGAARPTADTGASAQVPGEAEASGPGRGDGSGSGTAGTREAAGDGAAPGSTPVVPLAPAPTAALDRTTSAGLPVSPTALLGFGALLLLLAGLAHLLRGTDPAGRTQPPTA